MKKIFYFIASAIVALGAVACQNQFDEEFTPNTQNEGLSFTAAIDEETRITFNGAVTSWVAGDCIMINGYEFICTNGSSFSCTADGVRSLIGEEIEAVYSYNNNGYVDSKQAEKGAVLKATGTMLEANTTLTFSPQSAYLNFTSMQGTVVLRGKGLFVVDGETVDTFTVENKYGAQYVAINPTNEEIEFSYTYGGKPGKTILKKFVAGNVYKLGTLSAPVAEVDGVRYTDLSKALDAAGTTKVVTLLKEGQTINTACIISKESPTFNVADGYEAGFNNNNYIVLPVTGTTYLVPNENWKSDNAWFAAWQWGKTEILVKATDTNEDGIYEVPVLNGNTNINFNRMNPANTIADMWVGKWNEAAGDAIQADKYYYVTSWDGGIWESATWERPTNVIYFAPGPWTNDNAKISAWTWSGTDEGAWATKMFVDSAGVIAFDHTSNWTDVIFLRTSGQENTWAGEWNRSQTTVPTNGNNQYTVNDWDNYEWKLN